MHALLEQEAPGLFRALERLSPAQRRTALAAGSAVVAQSLGDLATAIRELVERATAQCGLSNDDTELARSMATVADEEYLDLQGSEKTRLASKRFSEARLLTALATGFGTTSVGNAADAAYELCKATDHPSLVIHAIEDVIERQL
jgi:hypothetical protein